MKLTQALSAIVLTTTLGTAWSSSANAYSLEIGAGTTQTHSDAGGMSTTHSINARLIFQL